jgi:hypothetical protein
VFPNLIKTGKINIMKEPAKILRAYVVCVQEKERGWRGGGRG